MKNSTSTLQSASEKRRDFLRIAGGAFGVVGFGSIAFSGTVAASRQDVRGRIQKADNKPASTNRVHAVSRGISKNAVTNQGGHFEIDPEGASHLGLGYYETVDNSLLLTSVKDGSPDIFTFPEVDVGQTPVRLGNIQLPDAHLLNVKVEDSNGNPVTNVRVRFVHFRNGSGFGSGRRLVNDDGMFQYGGADEPGIELVGDVRAEVWEENFEIGDEPIMQKRFVLSGERTLRFTLD